MKEVTISFTIEELKQLSKALYLASYFTMEMAEGEKWCPIEELLGRVSAIGNAEVPETGLFREGGYTETPFTISFDLAEECDPLVELYEDSAIFGYVPYELADRDFAEQYGHLDPDKLFSNPALLKVHKMLQEKYIKEFEIYGVTHLRLPEEEK